MRPRPVLPLAATVALLLAACGGEAEVVADPSDVDTSATTDSADVSVPAGEADADATADADADVAAVGTVTVDERAVPVTATACTDGPRVTAELADGGELEVASTDGAVAVTLTLVDEPGPGTWADGDVDVGTAGQERLSFTQAGVMGEAALGATDDGDDEVVVAFELPCP